MIGPLSQNQAKFVRSLQIKKYRDKEQAFWIEGVRLCEEALNASLEIEFCVIAYDLQKNDRNQLLLERFRKLGIPVFQAQENFKNLSGTESPQGIGCAVKYFNNKPDLNTAELLIMVDGLQDPGNMGTIIRTAEWFGFNGILTSHDCVDVLNPKVLRSTMGALFHIPIEEKTNPKETAETLKSLGFRLIGSVLEADSQPNIPAVKNKTCLIIGSEAHGIRKELYSYLDAKVCIPGAGKSESLNAAVAAGILMYTLGKNHG